MFARRIAELESLKVLARRDLLLFLDALAIQREAHLVLVHEGVVAAELPHDVSLDEVFVLREQERLVQLEELAMDLRRHAQVVTTLRRHKKELVHMGRQGRTPDEVEHGTDTMVHLFLERAKVRYDVEVRVTHPGVDEPPVKVHSFLNGFIPGFVAGRRVELLCAIRSRDEVNDGLVAALSQVHRRPAGLVKNGLPDNVVCVSLAVHDASIVQYDGGLRFLLGLRHLNKDVFEVHLKAHQIYLEVNRVFMRHLRSLDESATFHEDRGCLRHKKYAITHLAKVQGELGERGRLARAWATS